MSLDETIRERVNAAITAGATVGELTAPLINNLAYVLVRGCRSGDDPKLYREALEGLVEISRNELDEAVAHYDKVMPN